MDAVTVDITSLGTESNSDFFRFVSFTGTRKVTFKWSWGMKLQCWGTPLFWFLQSDSDQVAKFVPKRQKQPSFGRNPPRVYFTCFSLIYQKHRFEVDPVNCSIKPTSQEAKQLNFPCTPRDILGISFPNFLWRPGCTEAGPCKSSITSNKTSNKDLSKCLGDICQLPNIMAEKLAVIKDTLFKQPDWSYIYILEPLVAVVSRWMHFTLFPQNFSLSNAPAARCWYLCWQCAENLHGTRCVTGWSISVLWTWVWWVWWVLKTVRKTEAKMYHHCLCILSALLPCWEAEIWLKQLCLSNFDRPWCWIEDRLTMAY